MSAFICTDLHIYSVAHYVGSYFDIDVQQLADKLKAINIESVNYRYGDKTPKRKCKSVDVLQLNNDDIANLIDSLNYQSCVNNSVDYKAYSTLLKLWISENKAISRNGQYWSI